MRELFKRLFVFKVILALVLPTITPPALALTPSDAAYWNMNRSLSGVTQDALKARGYVASDPRTYSTLSSMSNVATTALSSASGAAAGVLAVTLLGATAPAWVSIAVMAGVGAVVGWGVNIALNSAVKWLFGAPDSPTPINVEGTSGSVPALENGGPYFSYANGAIIGASGDGVLNTAISVFFPSSATTLWRCTNFQASGPNVTCQRQRRDRTNESVAWGEWTGGITETAYYTASGSAYACPMGYVSKYGSCVAAVMPSTDGAKTVNQAVAQLTQEQLAQPLNPSIVASLANRLWLQAALQPGYAGIPYPAGNPITATEAQAWQQVNPEAWPTVGAFVQPRIDSQTNTNTVALPVNATDISTAPTTFTTSPNPATTNPAATSVQVNLGSDPGIGSPSLEAIPTAKQIVDPILNMLPGHKNFTVAAQAGECPKPTFELYGTHKLEAHCTLIDQNKATIQGAMLFAWAAIALFIVLSA